MAAYITLEELSRLGASERLLDRFSDEEVATAIDAASSEADCYLTGAYTMPLTGWPLALKLHVARATVYHLCSLQGFDPQGGDAIVVDNYSRALKFYEALQKSEQNMPDSETAPDRDDVVYVISTTPRRERW